MTNKITMSEAKDYYNDMLNECTPTIKIGYIEFDAADVLETMDPIAYDVGFNDYLDCLSDDYIIEDYNEE